MHDESFYISSHFVRLQCSSTLVTECLLPNGKYKEGKKLRYILLVQSLRFICLDSMMVAEIELLWPVGLAFYLCMSEYSVHH